MNGAWMDIINRDGFVKNPISALRVSFVTAEYNHYAAYGTRDSGIPQDSQALISGFLRIRLKCNFLRVHQFKSNHKNVS